MHGAMERDHGFAGSGRAGNARRAGKAALDDLALRGVQENRPFLPRVIERGLKFGDVLDHTEPAQRVGMRERDCRQARAAEHD